MDAVTAFYQQAGLPGADAVGAFYRSGLVASATPTEAPRISALAELIPLDRHEPGHGGDADSDTDGEQVEADLPEPESTMPPAAVADPAGAAAAAAASLPFDVDAFLTPAKSKLVDVDTFLADKRATHTPLQALRATMNAAQANTLDQLLDERGEQFETLMLRATTTAPTPADAATHAAALNTFIEHMGQAVHAHTQIMSEPAIQALRDCCPEHADWADMQVLILDHVAELVAAGEPVQLEGVISWARKKWRNWRAARKKKADDKKRAKEDEERAKREAETGAFALGRGPYDTDERAALYPSGEGGPHDAEWAEERSWLQKRNSLLASHTSAATFAALAGLAPAATASTDADQDGDALFADETEGAPLDLNIKDWFRRLGRKAKRVIGIKGGAPTPMTAVTARR
jgi:hypothetical protein